MEATTSKTQREETTIQHIIVIPQAKPSQAKVLTGGGDLREAQVERPPVC